jgi:hypothetical protein
MIGHVGLVLWGTDSLALVLDVDEYLMTAKPGLTVLEVGAGSQALACVELQ